MPQSFEIGSSASLEALDRSDRAIRVVLATGACVDRLRDQKSRNARLVALLR